MVVPMAGQAPAIGRNRQRPESSPCKCLTDVPPFPSADCRLIAGHSGCDPPFGFSSQIAACGGNGGRGNQPAVSSYRFQPPPSNQTEEQARFECMRLVRAGAISDAELLRLREQPLSWSAVLDLMHEQRADNALRALEQLARHHSFT
jgi:hypothetical protein